MCILCISKMALYFCTGSLKDEQLFKHYALNVPLYTHFTSPIRRYADIIVHRLLAYSLSMYLHYKRPLTDTETDAYILTNNRWSFVSKQCLLVFQDVCV